MLYKVSIIFHEVPRMFLEVSPGLGPAFTAQAFSSLGLVFIWLWLCSGYLQSWSCLWLAMVLYRLLLALVLSLLDFGCYQASLGLGAAFSELWLYTGFPSFGLAFARLWLCTCFPHLVLTFDWLFLCIRFPLPMFLFCWTVVVHTLSLVLILPLMGSSCVKDSPCLSFVFTGLWLFSGSLGSWCCLFCAVVVHKLPTVLVFPLVGCGCAQTSPSFGFAFGGLFLCIGFPCL